MSGTATSGLGHIEISPADLAIMSLVASGHTNMAISQVLEMSPRNVGGRIRAVQDLLTAPTKVAAVVMLIREGRL